MSKFWDQKFSQHPFIYGTQPSAFLRSQAHLFRPGQTILVPADGEGRNGVWLAEQGLTVTCVDSSPVGQTKAKQLAADRNVAPTFILADLLAWDWPTARFDAVVSIFFHLYPADRPRLHKAMLNAVKPGGMVILESFRPEQLTRTSGGPPEAELMYTAPMLQADFAEADMVLLEVVQPVLDEGPIHQGVAETVRMVARRRG